MKQVYQPLIKIMIYVLDDKKEILKGVEYAFEQAGINNYRMYTNEDEMIDEVTEDVQIVVIDYYLGKKTGVQVMKEVKAKQPLCQFIFMSSQSSVDMVIDIMNAGCSKYVRKDKPDFLDKLVEYVTEAAIEGDQRLRKTLQCAARINETITFFEEYRNGTAKIQNYR